MQDRAGNTIHCPNCSGVDVRLSHQRNSLDIALQSLLRVRPLRCRFCSKRFRRQLAAGQTESQTGLGIESERYSVRW